MPRTLKMTLGSALAIAVAACGQQAPSSDTPVANAPVSTEAPVASESERLNAFFEEAFQKAVARSPISQTNLGIKTNYDKWDIVTDERAVEDFEIQKALVERMRTEFDFEALDENAQLSYRLFEYQFEQTERAFPWRNYSYTFNQMFGQQSSIPAFLINQHRVASESDLQAYISRLNGVADYLGQHVANSQAAAEQGIRPPAFVYEYVLNDAQNVLTGFPFEEGATEDSPLFADVRMKIDALKLEEDKVTDYLAQAEAAMTSSVKPAYENLIAFLQADLQQATTDDGVWKLPDGGDYYAMRLNQMTTTDLTADEVHQIGLSEVARIHDEMRVIMETVGFEGTLQEFFEFMRTDEQFYYPNTDEGREQYLAEATAIIDNMNTRLPEIFNVFPKAELTVKRVEAFREQSAGKAFYQRPSPDGSRPGTYYANLYDMADMPIYQMEALAYHEGNPGHHMQIAIAQELEDIPKFRKFGGYTAYSEGWGLYTEYFPKEMGLYEDPYSDFGRLAMELWRAARLVVDTGLHHKQWTREEATQYLIDNTPNPEGDCIKAIDRYIVMPGQATAYKIGMNHILDLRERARNKLGDDFDIRGFHDTVLKNGAVPLAILTELVDEWVAEVDAG